MVCYFAPNTENAYSLNNITPTTSLDGSVTVQFGGCTPAIPNCLLIMPGWNYLVRLYRQQEKILNGQWTFPQAQPIS